MKSRLFWILIFFILVKCVEYNTTTPQASENMKSSKDNGTFVESFYLVKKGEVDIIESVWIEKVWKYETVNCGKVIKPQTNKQIVVRLSKTLPNLQRNNYIIDWKLSTGTGAIFGSGNGVYILRLPENGVVDTINIIVDEFSRSKKLHLGSFARK